MTDNCMLLLVLSASKDQETKRCRCGFGECFAVDQRGYRVYASTHTYIHASARARVHTGTRSTGIWHKADISISTGIPPTIPPRRRHGTTLSAETCIPVISLSREPRETGGVRRHREKAKDLLLPSDERRNRLEIGTAMAIRHFVFPYFFFSFRSHSRARVSFISR